MPAGTSRRIIVALSGGVDSAVAALLLRQAGHEVEALHMTNWDDAGEYCTAGRDLADARRVCADLDITLHHVNFEQEYREQVFADFLAELRAGRTPNPDVACNRHIKFGAFLRHALRLGAEQIATGHYARVEHGAQTRLLCAEDTSKDQTYFLHAVTAAALSQTVFPLGDLHKTEVRTLARRHGLANHARRDSTGICFIGNRPFAEFIDHWLPGQPGLIVDTDGITRGEHGGLHHYTLGQRQGLGIGGAADTPEDPWYVAAKDTRQNSLIVVQGHDHPALLSGSLTASEPTWINKTPADLRSGRQLLARVRYRQALAPCTVRAQADGLHVGFDEPQWAVTPGQHVVFYDAGACLGGATISSVSTLAPALSPVAATA